MFSENWLSAIKVLIFDMDGTLYQEDSFMDRYIRYLLEGTDREPETETAVSLGRAILSGEHPFKFGHFYHIRDHIALVRHEGSFIQGFTWEGSTAQHQQAADADLIHIGDPWGIAAVIARKFGLPEHKMQQAFERVRREMVLEPYRFEFRSALFEAIEALDAVDKKILMTNTYLASGIEFLDYMQIHHLFDEIYCGAEKPFGLQRYFTNLLKQGYKPYEILSIGDNPWNDLHPVKRLGGRTCFISPYTSADPERWDLRLATLDELERFMREIQQHKTRRELENGGNRAEKHKQEVQR